MGNQVRTPLFRRVSVAVLSVGLTAAVLAARPDPVQADPAPGGAPEACPESAMTEAAAVSAARACGGAVEDLSRRTETGRVLANPDGSQVVEEYAYPQRVQRQDGSWAELDATLVGNADGRFSPRASNVELSLSGGGSGALLTGRRAGSEVSLSWLGTLPQPEVRGATATYAEVLPGVDLVVTALETGFGEVLVVKDSAAARNPKLRSLVFGSRLRGLSWKQVAGQLVAVDGEGAVTLAATGPRMCHRRGGVQHGGGCRPVGASGWRL